MQNIFIGDEHCRCIKERDGCRARGICGVLFNLRGVHNHQPSNDDVLVLQLRSRLMDQAAASNDSLKEIFDRECLNSPVGHLINFGSFERSMRYARQRNQPLVPQSPQEFFDNGLNATNGHIGDEAFMKAFVSVELMGEAVIMTTNNLLRALRECREVIIDATFRCVPRMFYQVLTLGCFFDGYVRLLIF